MNQGGAPAPRKEPGPGKKPGKTILIIAGAVVAALLLGGLIFWLVKKPSGKQAAEDPLQELVNNPTVRADVTAPAFGIYETQAFPTRRNIIASGDHFVVNGASNTYFAYLPDQHWGIYIMRFDHHGNWSRRYLFCTGWNAITKELKLAAYDEQGTYVGEMVGTFAKQSGRYGYNCVFTNYKGKSATYHITEDVAAGDPVAANRGGATVYSSAYDGYVVIRNTPSLDSPAMGKFRNGPQGATYMGENGSWTQINYNGIVGWVHSSYVSRTPTKAVTVDVDGDDLEGIWNEDVTFYYLIFNNGKFMGTWDTSWQGSESGHYYLEGDEIVFVVDKYDVPEEMEGLVRKNSRYGLNGRTKSIEGLSRTDYVSEAEARQWEEEGMGGGLWWTRKQFQKIKAQNR